MPDDGVGVRSSSDEEVRHYRLRALDVVLHNDRVCQWIPDSYSYWVATMSKFLFFLRVLALVLLVATVSGGIGLVLLLWVLDGME